MRVRPVAVSMGFVLCLGSGPASGTDRPVSARRLQLAVKASTAKLRFTSKDPALPLPPFGSADDPTAGPATDVTIEILSPVEGIALLAIPAGTGAPGWSRVEKATPGHRFRNREAPAGPSPVKAYLLREGRTLQLAASAAGLPLAAPAQGALGIRITLGTTRICARFDGASILRDLPGAFLARNATAAALADCSDGALLGLPTTTTTLPACASSSFPECGGTCPGDATCTTTLGGCACISPSSPCDDTAPTCNGTCPVGEECVATDGSPFPGCGCLPVGTTSCGDTGAPTCGGACPDGGSCEPFYTLPALGSGVVCGCFAPGVCGAGGADCGPGLACGVIPPSGSPQCFPIFCTGAGYPTCGGPCGDGGVCRPIHIVNIGYSTCLCAPPGDCEVMPAVGVDCPSGEVCTTDVSAGTVTCELP